MRTPRDYVVIDTMHRTGGGFVRKLAEAAMAADDLNLQRLKDAFPELWAQYDEMTTLIQKRRDG